jgi:TldD protein
MHRRDWLRHVSATGLALVGDGWRGTAARAESIDDVFPRLAAAALDRGTALGASFADLRIMQSESESLVVRERMVQGVDAATQLGCSVRVLVGGAWGFAAGTDLTENGVAHLADVAVSLAAAQAGWRRRTIEIESLPRHEGRFVQPVGTDPFTVAVDDKLDRLLGIAGAALDAGANYCQAGLLAVRERTWLANTFGSRIVQSRTRLKPDCSVTVTDPRKGFAVRDGLVPAAAGGYEQMTRHDWTSLVTKAAAEAREKLHAPPVVPGRFDLVILPSNLWLTIHETVGHPTELDRALGAEANFAGTSFCTPPALDRLRYASGSVSFRGERTQPGGLATTAFDDDGVATAGNEFFIVENGVFRNFQMAIGQAAAIGRKGSNACAYAETAAAFPLQRMPNISLVPGPDPAMTVERLIADVDDGLLIDGAGSWSIDQQRKNFQFSGGVFRRIVGGRLAGMVRDVAYRGTSVDFWNACDGLGGEPTSELWGAFNCGKGQPQQTAAVSHGAVPARFRGIDVLCTAAAAAPKAASRDGACRGLRRSLHV